MQNKKTMQSISLAITLVYYFSCCFYMAYLLFNEFKSQQFHLISVAFSAVLIWWLSIIYGLVTKSKWVIPHVIASNFSIALLIALGKGLDFYIYIDNGDSFLKAFNNMKNYNNLLWVLMMLFLFFQALILSRNRKFY